MIPNYTNKTPISFRGVKDRYKFPSTIMVDYILAGHEVKTSTTDFIGIYPRGWNDLIQFVGFECAKYMPCAEETLDRCLEITCKPPVFNAKFNTDYQFVYVHHSNKVLGKSKFFRFVEECVDDPDDWKESEVPDWNNDSNWQDHKTYFAPMQNVNIGDASIEMGPLELEYNRVFFQNATFSNSIDKSDKACGGQDEASNACYMPPLEESFQTPSKRRALVKTSNFSGYHSPAKCYDFSSTSPESPDGRRIMRKSCAKDQGVNTDPDRPYRQNQPESKHTSNLQIITFSGRCDLKSGAVPKRCSKCQAPSDYQQKAKLMEYERDQAKHEAKMIEHEHYQARLQIRDLNTILDRVKSELELSQAAHAKLKVVSSMAIKDREEAVALANSLLMAIFGQVKADGDRNQALVQQALPSWLDMVHYCGQKYLIPAKQGGASRRNTLLKAIIGHQEEKIRYLESEISQLKWRKRVDPSICSRVTRAVGNGETTEISSEIKDMVEDETTDGNALKGGNQSPDSNENFEAWKDILTVEPKFYQLDAMLASNCEVVVDDQGEICSKKETEISPKEANNNNFVTKNLNPDVDGDDTTCSMCDLTLQDSAENTDNLT